MRNAGLHIFHGSLASYPGPPFNFAHGGLVCENKSSDVTLDKCGYVHGDASFHHDIVPCRVPMQSGASTQV